MAIVPHADATAAVTIAAESSAKKDGVIATTLDLSLLVTVIVTIVRFAGERSTEKDGIITITLALEWQQTPLARYSMMPHPALIAYCHNAVAIVLRMLQPAAMLQVDHQIFFA